MLTQAGFNVRRRSQFGPQTLRDIIRACPCRQAVRVPLRELNRTLVLRSDDEDLLSWLASQLSVPVDKQKGSTGEWDVGKELCVAALFKGQPRRLRRPGDTRKAYDLLEDGLELRPLYEQSGGALDAVQDKLRGQTNFSAMVSDRWRFCELHDGTAVAQEIYGDVYEETAGQEGDNFSAVVKKARELNVGDFHRERSLTMVLGGNTLHYGPDGTSATAGSGVTTTIGILKQIPRATVASSRDGRHPIGRGLPRRLLSDTTKVVAPLRPNVRREGSTHTFDTFGHSLTRDEVEGFVHSSTSPAFTSITNLDNPVVSSARRLVVDSYWRGLLMEAGNMQLSKNLTVVKPTAMLVRADAVQNMSTGDSVLILSQRPRIGKTTLAMHVANTDGAAVVSTGVCCVRLQPPSQPDPVLEVVGSPFSPVIRLGAVLGTLHPNAALEKIISVDAGAKYASYLREDQLWGLDRQFVVPMRQLYSNKTRIAGRVVGAVILDWEPAASTTRSGDLGPPTMASIASVEEVASCLLDNPYLTRLIPEYVHPTKMHHEQLGSLTLPHLASAPGPCVRVTGGVRFGAAAKLVRTMLGL